MYNKRDERLFNTIAWYESNKKNYQKFSKLVLEKIREALEERNILIAYSSFREKSLKSLKDKCEKTIIDNDSKKEILKYNDPKNEITDFAGVRIVTYLKSDIPLIKNVVENLFCIDYENSGDKIDSLSENEIGYLSMHYIVSLKDYSYENNKYKGYKCEVQIRTVLQDAWSQIFHDRQYKSGFNGIIPSYELKRKTNLIAGSLELIDSQIDDLVQEYDSMNKSILKEQRYQKILDLEIYPSSLFDYCRFKFNDRVNRYYDADATVSLLLEYNLKYIRDVDNIVQDSFVDAIIKTNQVTIDKLISYILIIDNPEKYFSLSGSAHFKSISRKSMELLSGFVYIDDLCNKHNIVIEQND